MKYDTAENMERVRECALITAREAVATLNALERLKQPSQRRYFSLESKSAVQVERETIQL